jgi:hypothetical protein
MNQAMDLAVVFSERNECSTPVKIQLGEGEHEMVGVSANGLVGFGLYLHVSCNNITIIGKGKGKTTILGGFYANGKQNVKMEQFTVTNRDGYGLFCKGSGSNVDVTECCFKRCEFSGMDVREGATVIATRCHFMENGHYGVSCYDANTKVRLNDSTMHHNVYDGLGACDHAVVNLHGTKTDIHSNRENGIWASKNGKVNIHLPSQHNTTHDNRTDRVQFNGGSIANINADGTFMHLGEVDDDDVDE